MYYQADKHLRPLLLYMFSSNIHHRLWLCNTIRVKDKDAREVNQESSMSGANTTHDFIFLCTKHLCTLTMSIDYLPMRQAHRFGHIHCTDLSR
jgi:hypothetical protein